MSSRTKKHSWPASLAIVLGLAVMVAVLMLPVGSAQAQPTNPLKPSTPMLTPTVDSASQITLNWTASTTEAGLDITGYMVERKSGGGNFAAVSPAHTGTGTTYVDMGLTPSTSYTYQVRAMAGSFQSDWSTEAMAMTMATGTGTTPPGTGQDVFAITSSSTSASSTVELKVKITNLSQELVVGSSIELYLEDDYQVPDSIPTGAAYFVVTNADGTELAGNRQRRSGAGRVTGDNPN